MAVDNSDLIDSCGIDKDSGDAVLNIADHLPWSDEGHLIALQAKINRYLDFIESGQLIGDYPAARGRPVRIAIWCKYPPDERGREFIGKAETLLSSVNCRLTCHVPSNT